MLPFLFILPSTPRNGKVLSSDHSTERFPFNSFKFQVINLSKEKLLSEVYKLHEYMDKDIHSHFARDSYETEIMRDKCE